MHHCLLLIIETINLTSDLVQNHLEQLLVFWTCGKIRNGLEHAKDS